MVLSVNKSVAVNTNFVRIFYSKMLKKAKKCANISLDMFNLQLHRRKWLCQQKENQFTANLPLFA